MNRKRQHGISLIETLYTTTIGQQVLKVLIQRPVSRLAGAVLNSRVSKILIKPFVEKNQMDLSEYPKREYASFNDFFTRRIDPLRRPIDQDPLALVAPCDGKLTAIQVTDDARFHVKGVLYTMESLLRDEELAEKYQGGMLLLFRLTVDDYHRYCYVSDGIAGKNHRIPGVYHTVNPLAAERMPIYRENTREYSILQTAEFGDILTMEVGALLVGKILNLPHGAQVLRGHEKGYFQFGGSTVILILEQGRVKLDEDILNNSYIGKETIVRMGERIGYAKEAEKAL